MIPMQDQCLLLNAADPMTQDHAAHGPCEGRGPGGNRHMAHGSPGRHVAPAVS